MKRLWLAAGCCALLLLPPAPAAARDARAAEVRALAQQALDDPAALDRLRAIDSINGRPVDLSSALESTSRAALDARLESLAAGGEVPAPIGADQAREAAREVLGQGKFDQSDVPRPFQGLLDAIGQRLGPVGEWLSDVANRLTGGHPEWLLIGLLALVALAAGSAASRVIRRRAGASVASLRTDVTATKMPATELDAMAGRAELSGDLELAIRLRFKAGLIRLSDTHAIPERPSLTSGEVAALLRSRNFEEVAATFDEVVYGRRSPNSTDVARTRAGWDAVLRETRNS